MSPDEEEYAALMYKFMTAKPGRSQRKAAKAYVDKYEEISLAIGSDAAYAMYIRTALRREWENA